MMDMPQRQVSWIETFPPDIWAYFAWYLPGEQLGRLMMTGAMGLWQRLKSPQVVKTIKLGKDYFSFKAWPRLLNDFPSLEELSIHSRGLDWSHSLSLMIDSVPSGLRKLELSGSWAKFLTSGLSKLTRLEILDVFDLKCRDSSWITHCPNLKKLSIRHWDGIVALPSSLLDFEAYDVDLNTQTFVSKLPPNLESFVVTHEIIGIDLVLPLLPPSIRTVFFGYSAWLSDRTRSPTLQNYLEALPKSLTWLVVPSYIFNDFEAPSELASLLPTALTEIDIELRFPTSEWPLLPRNLTKLSLYTPIKLVDISHHEVTSIPFNSLPRSITSLTLKPTLSMHPYFCGLPNVSNCSFFPPQLTHLDISSVQVAPDIAKLLPPSLTYLEIQNLCERVSEQLPSGLKTLIANGTLMSPNLINLLPKSLTFLRLSLVLSHHAWYDYETGKMIERISNLSEYSIHKNCVANWKGTTSLPHSLIYFNLRDAKDLGDSFMSYQQLANLLELNLSDSEHFSDSSIPLLPRHLTTLDFKSSQNVTGKSFEFLPRGLTYLDLNKSESIFDSDVQHLPRTLKQAHLNRAICLTNLCIPDLPRHLELLSLQDNVLITPSSLPNFPYSILSSQNNRSAYFAHWSIRYGVARRGK